MLFCVNAILAMPPRFKQASVWLNKSLSPIGTKGAPCPPWVRSMRTAWPRASRWCRTIRCRSTRAPCIRHSCGSSRRVGSRAAGRPPKAIAKQSTTRSRRRAVGARRSWRAPCSTGSGVLQLAGLAAEDAVRVDRIAGDRRH